jgi:hypothetical protein
MGSRIDQTRFCGPNFEQQRGWGRFRLTDWKLLTVDGKLAPAPPTRQPGRRQALIRWNVLDYSQHRFVEV